MAFKGVGRAVAKGLPFTFSWSGDSTPVLADNNRAMGLDYTHDVQSTVHRDGNSVPFAVTADVPEHAISIRTIPVAPSDTNTLVGAKSMIRIPDVLTYVTLASSPHADFDGTWLYRGGATISYTPDGLPEISMTLYRYGFDVGSAISLGSAIDL
jgi:hypothetical protein